MTLQQLTVHHIRNLKHVDIFPGQGVNIFYGDNGSGKTSLLEAIHFLATTRTFRSRVAEPLINHDETSATVFGRLEDQDGTHHALGVSRDRQGQREVRIDGQRQFLASQLAELLPLRFIGPDSVQLLTGTPDQRRQYLNWGMFHVEHGFWSVWKQANHCLRQRNALLKLPKINRKELLVWTQSLAQADEHLHHLRQQYISQLTPVVTQLVEELLDRKGFELAYHPGWSSGRSIAEALEQQTEADIERGYTNSGHHRAEIRVKLAGQEVQDTLSRGEMKLVAWAMLLAQGRLNDLADGREVCYLIDDLAAELDPERRDRVRKALMASRAQIFVTTVTRETEADHWPGTTQQLFHVKQGGIEQEDV